MNKEKLKISRGRYGYSRDKLLDFLDYYNITNTSGNKQDLAKRLLDISSYNKENKEENKENKDDNISSQEENKEITEKKNNNKIDIDTLIISKGSKGYTKNELDEFADQYNVSTKGSKQVVAKRILKAIGSPKGVIKTTEIELDIKKLRKSRGSKGYSKKNLEDFADLYKVSTSGTKQEISKRILNEINDEDMSGYLKYKQIQLFPRKKFYRVGMFSDGSCYVYSLLYSYNPKWSDIKEGKPDIPFRNLKNKKDIKEFGKDFRIYISESFTLEYYYGFNNSTLLSFSELDDDFKYEKIKKDLKKKCEWYNEIMIMITASILNIGVIIVNENGNVRNIIDSYEFNGVKHDYNNYVIVYYHENHYEGIGYNNKYYFHLKDKIIQDLIKEYNESVNNIKRSSSLDTPSSYSSNSISSSSSNTPKRRSSLGSPSLGKSPSLSLNRSPYLNKSPSLSLNRSPSLSKSPSLSLNRSPSLNKSPIKKSGKVIRKGREKRSSLSKSPKKYKSKSPKKDKSKSPKKDNKSKSPKKDTVNKRRSSLSKSPKKGSIKKSVTYDPALPSPDSDYDYNEDEKLLYEHVSPGTLSSNSSTSTLPSPIEEFKSDSYIYGLYKIINEIGSGAYGTVFKGKDLETGELVAIKKIDKEDDIEPERHYYEFLHDPRREHICDDSLIQYKEIIETKNYIYIVMEYINGETLSRYNGGKEASVYIRFMREAIEALLCMREHNIIHNDIKNDNLMYDIDNDKLKMLDFGISCFLKNHIDSCDYRGYIHLNSPILLYHNQDYDFYRIKKDKLVDILFDYDIWSLGLVLYQLVMDKLPFDDYIDNDYSAESVMRYWYYVSNDVRKIDLYKGGNKKERELINNTLKELLYVPPVFKDIKTNIILENRYNEMIESEKLNARIRKRSSKIEKIILDKNINGQKIFEIFDSVDDNYINSRNINLKEILQNLKQ